MDLSAKLKDKYTCYSTALAATAFAFSAYLAVVVFHSYPNCMDEYSYLYQAQIFASGNTHITVDRGLMGLVERYMLVNDDQWLYSKYPPLFSALLAIGVLLGAAALVNPLFTAGTTFLVMGSLRGKVSNTVAYATGLLLVTNIYLLGYGGSFFAQPLSLFLTAGGFYFLFRHEASGQLRHWAYAALCAAALCLVRQVDALCLAIALGADLLLTWRKKRWQGLSLLAAISASGLAALLLFNYMMGGQLRIANYQIWTSEFRLYDPEANGFWENLASITSDYIAAFEKFVPSIFKHHLVPHIGPGFLALVVVGMCMWRSKHAITCALHIIACVLLYNFHASYGWPQYGARYWYVCIVPLALFAAHGIQAIWNAIPRLSPALLVVLVLFQLHNAYGRTQLYAHRFDFKLAILRQIEKTCPAPSIVLFLREPGLVRWGPSYVQWPDYIRNPFLNGERLYAYDPKYAQHLSKLFPEHRMCTYTFRKPHRP